MAIRNLSQNQTAILKELAQHDYYVSTSEIHIDGLKSNTIGRILFSLLNTGLVERHKGPKEHIYRWKIIESGRSLVDGTMLQASVQGPVKEAPKTTSVAAIDAPPPAAPDHFVFVVSEQKLQDMLLSRLGSGAEENALLKARIKTLEMTITEIKKQMDLLRRERDTALEMAEYMEKKMGIIHDALKDKL